MVIKTNECEEMKKKHIDLITEEKRKNNELESLLKKKEEELSKAYQLLD